MSDPAATALPRAVQELIDLLSNFIIPVWLKAGFDPFVANRLTDGVRALEQGRAQAPVWQPPATAPLDTPLFAYFESPTGYREYAVLRQTRWGNPETRIWRNGDDIVNQPDGWMLPPGGEMAP